MRQTRESKKASAEVRYTPAEHVPGGTATRSSHPGWRCRECISKSCIFYRQRVSHTEAAHRSQARSITPFPPRSSPALTLPPTFRGAPIRRNHLHKAMVAPREKIWMAMTFLDGKNKRDVVSARRRRKAKASSFASEERCQFL